MAYKTWSDDQQHGFWVTLFVCFTISVLCSGGFGWGIYHSKVVHGELAKHQCIKAINANVTVLLCKGDSYQQNVYISKTTK